MKSLHALSCGALVLFALAPPVFAQEGSALSPPQTTVPAPERPLSFQQPVGDGSLEIRQTGSDAFDRCEPSVKGPAIGIGCDDTGLMIDADGARDRDDVLQVRSDGAYLRIAPTGDETFEPDQIARRLAEDETIATDDWGASGAVSSSIGFVSEPPEVPAILPFQDDFEGSPQ